MAIQLDPEDRWVRIYKPAGTSVQLWAPRAVGADPDEPVDFAVAVHGPGLEAHTTVRSLELGGGVPTSRLRTFFRALVEHWRPAVVEISWEGVQDDLSIIATPDPSGQPLLTFRLRHGSMFHPWVVEACVLLETPEETAQLASAIERVFPTP